MQRYFLSLFLWVGPLAVWSEVADSVVGFNNTFLDEIVVTAKAPIYSGKLDRKVYNVSEDVLSAAGSLSDILQNVPSLDVDIDGSISLRGSQNVTILINGRPSAMMDSKNRGDILNQIAASTIERIEVITNPSAEFKPDGTGGIINIVLKRNSRFGLNGTLVGNTGSYGRYNSSLNLNHRWKVINLYGDYSFRRDRYDRTTDDQRKSTTDNIHMTTYGLGRPISHTFRLGINWYISENDVLDIEGCYSRRNFHRNEHIESVTEDYSDTLIDYYLRDRNADAKENMWDASVNYEHTFGESNTLSAEYVYSSESEDEWNYYSTLRMDEREYDKEWVWDAQYLHMGKVQWNREWTNSTQLSLGYTLEKVTAQQSYHLYDLVEADYVPNAPQTRDFESKSTLNSLYATMRTDINRFNLMLGMRGEYVDIKNHLLSGNEIIRQHYANFYPTLHSAFQLNPENEFQLNYSLRVKRPSGDDMNPYAERINPLSLKHGNPHLRPEKIHSVELGWRILLPNGSFMSTLYYRYTINKITEVSEYDSNGVMVTTKENMNTSQNVGFELIWSCSPLSWLSLNWNVNGYYNQINADNLGYNRNRNTFSWSTLVNFNFTPCRHLTVQTNVRMRGARLKPQGKQDGDSRVNLGIKYEIPKINLSVMLSVTDLFDTYKKSSTLETSNYTQKIKSRRNPRILYIGAVWQFGTGKKQKTELEYDEGM